MRKLITEQLAMQLVEGAVALQIIGQQWEGAAAEQNTVYQGSLQVS